MSNSPYTDFMRAPSGRSIRRLRQDAKRQKTSLDSVIKNAGINLPWGVALDYLKDKDLLQVTQGLGDIKSLQPLVPTPGRVNFIIGTPGSLVSETALQTMVVSAMLNPSSNIGYCDFAVEKKNSVPIASNFLRSATLIDAEQRKPYLHELEKLTTAWHKSFELLREKAAKFQSVRVPQQLRFKNRADTLIFSMNPRKHAINKLAKLNDSTGLVIADNQCQSVLDLGGVGHWQQLHDERCAMDRRQLLSRTGCIVEQRVAQLGDDKILLSRRVELSDTDRASFEAIEQPLKRAVNDVRDKMESWSTVADRLEVSDSVQAERLAAAVERMDRSDDKLVAVSSKTVVSASMTV